MNCKNHRERKVYAKGLCQSCYQIKWNRKSPKYKAYHKAYQKVYKQTPKQKAYRRAYYLKNKK